MKNYKLVLAATAMALVVALSGCGKDPAASPGNSETPDVTNPNTPLPDPEGTVTANISTTTRIDITNNQDNGYIKWTGPDNFNIYGGYYNTRLVSICNLGAMKGLGNITNIPQTSYTTPQYSTTTVACEVGHGYVIKFESLNYGTLFVRLYVQESIINTSGGVMGAMVKYQYPFAPPFTVTFDSNGGSAVSPQTVAWGTEMAEPSTPTKTGYGFGGWYTDNNTFASEVTFPYTVNANITLYAKWVADIAIRTADDLNAIRNNLSGTYILMNDISLAGYSNWQPIGSAFIDTSGNIGGTPFTGRLNGNGHKITGLAITSKAFVAGLFGYIKGGFVSDLGVEIAAGGIIVSDDGAAGGITGYLDGGTITNCYTTGNISSDCSGGIAGFIENGSTITNCYSTGNISSSIDYGDSGGIAGGVNIIFYESTGSTITNCAAINPTIKSTGIEGRAGRIASVVEYTCTVSNNFALSTMTVTGDQSLAINGTSKTDAQLKTQSTYSGAVSGDGAGGLGWAFGSTDTAPWKMPAGGGYPILYGQ